MLTVKRQGYKDLSKEEQDEQPNNGAGKEYASYLRILHDGKTIALNSDAMEPEDACFGRDLSWISDALMEAYKLGKMDALGIGPEDLKLAHEDRRPDLYG